MRLAVMALIMAVTPLSAQRPPIGSIDFYGTHSLTPHQLSNALRVQVGSPVSATLESDIRARLLALPGVAAADVSVVCCEEGRSMLYVGVAQRMDTTLSFRRAPTGAARLPATMMQAGAAFNTALMEGVQRGETSEDDSQGHALMAYAPARAIQQQFITYAGTHLPLLREVLRSSGDAEHRALAAMIMAYSDNKSTIIPDLVAALRDPNETVRNNAARALGVLAMYAQKNPASHLSVPVAPFIAMLNSPEWTDRNKASFVLMALTESRDPLILTQLRVRALDALAQMARWQTFGHAFPAGLMLGRLAGIPDDQIMQRFQEDREALISAAREVR